MPESKRVKLADLEKCSAQIFQDAAEGVQTIVEDEDGKTVMVAGTSKERRFFPNQDPEEWLEKILAEDDPDEPVPDSDWLR